MNSVELKNNFHELTDSIDNEPLLMNLCQILKSRSALKDGDLWNQLSYENQKELLSLAHDVDKGEE